MEHVKRADLCSGCRYGKYIPSVIMKACVFSCSCDGGCERVKQGLEKAEERRNVKRGM